MIEMVWEMVAKQENQGQLELLYGPGGAWSKLFGKAPGFRGTTVLKDTHRPTRYLIIDVWDSEDLRAQAVSECADEYAKLNATLENWTESKIELGVFKVRTEAAVRPRGKSSRRPPRSSR